jgi:hypothetical protein
MHIPIEFIVLALTGFFAFVGAVISFVFKICFGLINKNEVKSEEGDQRLEKKSDEHRLEMKEIEERYRANDRELYKENADLREFKAKIEGIEIGRNESK